MQVNFIFTKHVGMTLDWYFVAYLLSCRILLMQWLELF